MEDMKQDLINNIINSFGSLNNLVADVISIVSETPQGFSASIYGTMETIANAIIPIAIVIAVLFFIRELCEKTLMMEIVSWENVAKLLLKLIIAKVMIQSSFWLLEAIFAYVVHIMGIVGDTALNIPAFDESIIRNEVNGKGLFALLGFWTSVSLLNFVMWIVTWIIKVIVYGRMIEIYILFAISPLPISTIAGEGVHDIAKKFFQNFVAVSLQGVIIIIAIGIYAGFSGEIIGIADQGALYYLGNYILMSLILTLILFKSGTWAKQVVGLM